MLNILLSVLVLVCTTALVYFLPKLTKRRFMRKIARYSVIFMMIIVSTGITTSLPVTGIGLLDVAIWMLPVMAVVFVLRLLPRMENAVLVSGYMLVTMLLVLAFYGFVTIVAEKLLNFGDFMIQGLVGTLYAFLLMVISLAGSFRILYYHAYLLNTAPVRSERVNILDRAVASVMYALLVDTFVVVGPVRKYGIARIVIGLAVAAAMYAADLKYHDRLMDRAASCKENETPGKLESLRIRLRERVWDALNL